MPKERRSANINLPRVTSTTGVTVVSGGGGGGSQPGTLTGTTTNTVTSAGLHYHAVQLPHASLLGIGPADHHAPVTVGNTGLSIAGQQVSLRLATVSGLEVDGGLKLADSIAGDGLSIANKVLSVGVSGLGLSVGADAVTLTSSSNPGAAASILASDASGYLQLTRIGLGTAPSYPLHVSGDAVVTRLGIGAAPDYPLHVIGAGRIDGDLTFVGAQSILTTADSLTLAPAADLDLTPGGTARVRATSGVRLQSDNYVSQTTGWAMSYAGGLDARYIYTDELHAKSFITDLEQALAGGQIIAKSVAVVAQDFTVPAPSSGTWLYVEDLPGATGMAVFQENDWIRLRQFSRGSGSLTVAYCTGYVASYIDQGNGTQRWYFYRPGGGWGGTATAGTTIEKGTLALDYGVSGNGFYEVNAIDGAWAENSPYAQVATWSVHPANVAVRSRWGNLKGIFNAANEYGLYAGDGVTDASKFLRISSQTVEAHNLPIRMYDGSTATIALDPAAPSFAMGATLPSAYGTGDGLWAGKDGATYKFRVGAPTGAMLAWDGSVLSLRRNNVERIGLTAAGVLTIKDSAGSAVITLDASAGAEITKKLTMPGANSAIAIGATPPTANNSGTGIWIDRTGMYGLKSGALQAKFDATTGAITAGAGAVALAAGGLTLTAVGDDYDEKRAIRWKDGATDLSTIYGKLIAGSNGFYIECSKITGYNSNVDIRALAPSGKVGEVYLGAGSDGSGVGVFSLKGMTDGTGICQLTTTNFIHNGQNAYLYGGLNLGTATGARAGNIIMANSGAGDTLLSVRDVNDSYAERANIGHWDGSGGLFNLWDDAGTNTVKIRGYASGGVQGWLNAGRILIGTTSDDGVNLLQVNGSVKAIYAEMNWLQILDGIAAPATVAGLARIYVDSADGDLKIKFGNGTVKTIVTD